MAKKDRDEHFIPSRCGPADSDKCILSSHDCASLSFGDPDKLFKKIEQLSTKADAKRPSSFVFRGSSDNRHRLHSTFDRALHKHGWQPKKKLDARHLEEVLYRKFVREAHLHLPDVPDEREILEWLALMRHYGGPTRLLDWSYSPWIALYFAAAGAGGRGTAAVWALESKAIDEAAHDIREAKHALERRDTDLHCRKRSTFRHVFNARDPEPFVLKQNCWRTNPRLVVQQGVFLCPSDIERCFQRNLKAVIQDARAKRDGEHVLHRIEFPASWAQEILGRLYRYGISHASLYPDLDGLTKALSDVPAIRALQARDLKMRGIGGKEPRRRKRRKR